MALWAPENVYAAGGSIVGTAFGADNAQALVDDNCMMHRQASFFASFLAEVGGTFGTDEGQVDVFYFPANEGQPTLVGANNAAAFADRPEVWAVMQYIGSAEFANARQTAQAALAVAASGEGASSGFLTAAAGRRHVAVPAARAEVPRDPAERRPGRVRRIRRDAVRGRIAGVLGQRDGVRQRRQSRAGGR